MPKFIIPKKQIHIESSDGFELGDDDDLAALNRANNDMHLDDKVRQKILNQERSSLRHRSVESDEEDAVEVIEEFIEEIQNSINQRVGPMEKHKKLMGEQALTCLPDGIRLVVFNLMGTLVDDHVAMGTRLEKPLFNVALTSALKSYGIHIFPEDCDKHRGSTPRKALKALLRAVS